MSPLVVGLLVAGATAVLLCAPDDRLGRLALASSGRPRPPLVGAFVAGVFAPLGAALVAALRPRRRAQARRQRQLRVIDLCDGLAAELSAGLPPLAALGHVCRDLPELAPIAAQANLGGDVADALRRAALQPGAEGLRLVAAGWQVAGQSGAGLAAVLDRIADGLRHDEEARAEVLAALAPPRATAKLLAALPLAGLALGASIGARPLQFLFGSVAGLLCLVVGALLAAAGLWWVERLARSAEP